MIPAMIFHHIGYAVHSIEATAKHYSAAGWSLSPITFDPFQKCNIAFLAKAGYPCIELVEQAKDDINHNPNLRGDGNNILNNILKNGVTPYHFCYEVPDINRAIIELRKQHYLLLFNPIPASALDNRPICYLMHPDVGLIELLQK